MDLTDIIEIPNFLSEDDANKVWEYQQRPNWRYGHGSNANDNIKFWQMELSNDEYFSHYLFKKVIEKTGSDFFLERVYANGHMYGTSGSPHHDSFNSLDRTALYYANPIWESVWGGKTAFNLNDEHHFVLPEPNKLVIFPGLIAHWAEESSRNFTGLRMTIAWKLIHESNRPKNNDFQNV